VRLVSARGERWVQAAEFFQSYLTTAAEPEELLVEVAFPVCEAGWGFAEFSRRQGDFALAAVAVGRSVAGDARIAVAGGGPTPVLAAAATQALVGQKLTESVIREVAQMAAEACPVESDVHASADYRKGLIGVLAERALSAARDSAGYARAD
jgi:CO/xanthine dehydrogenase FAD-binding subunit